MVTIMKIEMHKGVIEKLKDRLVDGCLIFDGAIVFLAVALAVSVMFSYSALVL